MIPIRKARRPTWQDYRPPDIELASSWKIADSHQRSFSRVFGGIVRDLSGEISDRAGAALRESYAVDSVMRAIPWWTPGDRDDLWTTAEKRLAAAYGKVVDESASVSRRNLAAVLKQDPLEAASNADWVGAQSATLVKQISDYQRLAIRELLQRAIDAGENPSTIVTRLRRQIGLLPKQLVTLSKRMSALKEAGITGAKLDKAIARYEKQMLTRRAENIARTELIRAESFGRRMAWQEAERAGMFAGQKVERVWIAAAGTRTCEICETLDGQTAGVDSSYDGGLDGPPAHPSCRCSEGLRFL